MFFEAHDSSPERYPVPLSGCDSNLAPWGNCCCAPMVSAGAAWLGLPARVSHCFEVGEGRGASLGRTPGFSKKGRATRRVNLSVSSYMENGGLAILPSLADRGIKKSLSWAAMLDTIKSKKAKHFKSGSSQSLEQFVKWQILHPCIEIGSFFL